MTSLCGGLKVLSHNGVKMYCITGHRYGAAPIPKNKLKSLRRDEDFRRRLDVIHDLKFETVTSKIKVTPDGEYVVASGIYPPQVNVCELKNMALKFERHLISEIINFQVLDDDYSKIAFLCANRSVCLHAKYGSHYNLRIPRMGRDIAYDCWSCDLLCAASSSDIYRINLEQGRFLSSLNTQAPAINVVSQRMVHRLLACGGEDDSVECFDLRTKSSVGWINTCMAAGDSNAEVTAVQFEYDSGFRLAVGSSSGKVLIYDWCLSNPIKEKDHKNDSPIVSIKWHQSISSVTPKLISADRHIVNIWDPDTGEEESAETILYENLKFVTEEELERLDLGYLKSSNLVKPELHGYFINYEVYKKIKRKLPRVNRLYAASILENQETEGEVDKDGTYI